MTSEEIIKLVLETSGVEGLAALGAEAAKTAEALAKVAETAGSLEKKTLDINALTASGQGLFSAFQSQDVPGIISNVAEVVELIPVVGQWAGYIRKAGAAAEYAWPLIKDLYAAYSADDTKKAIKETEDYGERVDDLGESLKNLTDHTASLNAERERGNKLLEVEATWVEKLNKLRPEDNGSADAAAKERSENLSSVMGGKQEEVVEDVSLGMAAEEDTAVDEEMRQVWPAGTKFGDLSYEARVRYGELVGRQSAMQKGIPKDIQDKARKTTAGAVVGGKEEDLRKVLKYLPKGSKFRQGFKNELPEEKELQDAMDKDFEDDLVKRSAAVKGRNKFNKEGKDLTAQGRENEEHMRAQMEHDKEADAKETDRKYQQSLKETNDLAKRQAAEVGPRQVQREAQNMGMMIDLQQATEIFKQRQAEQSKAQNERTRRLLDNQGAMTDRMDNIEFNLRAGNVYQKNANPKGRTAQSLGMN